MKVKGFFLRTLLAVAMILPLSMHAQQVVSLSNYTPSRTVQGFNSLFDPAMTGVTIHSTYPATVDQLFDMDFGNSNVTAPTLTVDLNGSVTFGTNVIKPLYNAGFVAGNATGCIASKTTADQTIIEWLVALGTDTLNFQMSMNSHGAIEFRYGMMKLPAATTAQVGFEEGTDKWYLSSAWNASPIMAGAPVNLGLSSTNNPHPFPVVAYVYTFNRYCYHSMVADVTCPNYPYYQWNFDFYATDATNQHYYRRGTGSGTPSLAINGPIFHVDSLYNLAAVNHDTLLSYLIVDSADANYAPYYTDRCEHIGVLPLHVAVPTKSVENLTVCDSYTWPVTGLTYTTSGTYKDTVVAGNAEGCDSVVTLNLTVKQSAHTTVDMTGVHYQCDSFTWHGTTYTASVAGVDDTLVAANGCDSVVTLKLEIRNSSNSSSSLTVCDTYTWNLADFGGATGSWTSPAYTTSGAYTHVVKNAAGCDSTLTLNLTVNYSTTSAIDTTACDNFTLTVRDFDNDPASEQTFTYTTPGVHTETIVVKNAAGCDSTISFSLKLNASSTYEKTVFATANYNWTIDAATAFGFTASKDTTIHLTNMVGCDSAMTLHLTIMPMVIDTTCGGWYNNVYYTRDTVLYDTTLYHTTFNTPGSDSIVVAAHQIISRQYHMERVLSDQDLTWKNGTTYTANTNRLNPPFYNKTSVLNGCDSTWFLQYTRTNELRLCKEQLPYTLNLYGYNYVVELGSNPVNSSFVINDTIKFVTNPTTLAFDTLFNNTSMANVDSMYVVNLNCIILDYSTVPGTDAIDTCVAFVAGDLAASTHAFVYGDSTFTFTTANATVISDNKVVRFTTAEGCDSVINVAFTIRPTYTTEHIVHDWCDGHAWDNSADFATTDPQYVSMTAAEVVAGTDGTARKLFTVPAVIGGCDSNVTVVLEIIPNSADTVVVDYCVDFATEKPVFEIKNADGSVAYTVNAGDFTVIDPAFAFTAMPANDTNIAPIDDTIAFTVVSENGCDSNVVMVLRGHGVLVDTLPAIVNSDAHYLFRNKMYNVPSWAKWLDTNIYYAEGVTPWGCDSVHIQRLLVGRTNDSSWNVDVCQQFVWSVYDSIMDTTFTRTFVYRDRDAAHLSTNPWYYEIVDGQYVAIEGVNPSIRHKQSNGIFDSVDYLILTLAEGISTFDTVRLNMVDLYRDSVAASAANLYAYTKTSASRTSASVMVDSLFNFTAARTAKHDTILDMVFNHEFSARYCDSINNYHVVLDYTSANTFDTVTVYMSEIEATHIYTYDANTTPAFEFNFDSLWTLRHGTTLDTAVNYAMEDFAGLNVCDSLVNVHINVVWNYDTVALDTICIHENVYTLAHTDATGVTFDAATTAMDVNTALAGIQVNTMPYTTDFDTNYVFEYSVYTNGVPVKYYAPVLQLKKLYGTDYQVSCDTYTWINGHTYDASTTIPTHLLEGGSVNGCDSLVTLNLTMFYHATGTDVLVACDSLTWIDGVKYTASNSTATWTIANGSVNGCDSVVSLNLTVNNAKYTPITDAICGSTYRASGYTWTVSDEDGTTNLHTKTYTVATHPIVNFNADTTIVDTAIVKTVKGCDSTITLSLTVKGYSRDTLVACNTNTVPGTWSYDWMGRTYASVLNPHFSFVEGTADSVVFFADTVDAAGTSCDSIYVLALNLKAPHYIDTVAYACDDEWTWDRTSVVYTWNESTKKFNTTLNSGDTVATYVASNSTCGAIDTVIRLQLIKSGKTFGIDYAGEQCNAYDWTLTDFDGTPVHVGVFEQSYHAPFSPSYALHNNPLTNCDSIVYLDLTIIDSASLTTYDTVHICSADLPYTYVYDGQNYEITAGGTYRYITPSLGNTAHCDSIRYATIDVTTPTLDTVMFTNFVGLTPTKVADTMICLGTDMTYTTPSGYSFAFNFNVDYLVDGTYTVLDSTYNTYGCLDTIFVVNIKVLPTTYKTLDTVVSCRPTFAWKADETYERLALRYGQPVAGPRGQFTAATFSTDSTATTIITNVYGCDSVIFQAFRHDDINRHYNDSINICNGTPYVWTGASGNLYTITSDSTIYDTVILAGECDSLYIQKFYLRNATAYTDVQVACDSYTWMDGVTYTANNNTATVHTTNMYGCDSTITLDLTVNHSTSTHLLPITVCDSYTWPLNGATYTATNNTDFVVLSTTKGCDSTVYLHVNVNYSNTGVDVQTACDSYVWLDGNTYAASISGPTYTLTNVAGCDSVVTLNLTVNHSNTGVDVQTACDSYTWIDGNTYTASNHTATYTLAGANVMGCDSVVTLDLTINRSAATTMPIVACDSYTWINGVTYTASTSLPTYTMTTIDGCDSVITLNLTVNYSNSGNDVITACDSYTWINGVTYTASNATDQVVLTNQYGCDSVVTLNLTVNYSNTGNDVQVACDSYTWPLNGITYTTSTSVPTVTLTNAAGCDSVVTLNLTVNYKTTGIDFQTACDSYTWINGVTYTTNNHYATYTLAGANSNGCDSIVTLDLTVHYSAATTMPVVACDSYTWINGVTYTASTSLPTYTMSTIYGCDSVITLNLTVNYSTDGDDIIAACDSYTWPLNGQFYTASNYSDVAHLVNAAGCDSTVHLQLTINHSDATLEPHVACDSYTWPLNGITYTASTSTPSVVLTNQYGCDSIVTLALTVNYSTSSTETYAVCDSYTWNGTTYTNSGIYYYTGVNAAGCDSNMTLFLTVRGATYGSQTEVVCDNYTWINGVTYTASTVANYTLAGANQYGCDSVVTLNLTVYNSTTGDEYQTACDSYTWNGTTYTMSTTATHQFFTAHGCDSTAVLHLTINHSTASTDVQTACDSYTWMNGVTYTASTNTATYTTVNAHGCDSVITLNLTINNSTSSNTIVTACDSYTWNGTTYTTSTTTNRHFVNAAGCDSTATLQLTINTYSTGSQTVVACDSYTWINGVTYTASTSMPTYTLTSSTGCDSIVTLNLTVNYSSSEVDNQIACDTYTWINGLTYATSVAPGIVNAVYTNVYGCDSVVTLALTIVNSQTTTDNQVACDSYTWAGTDYTTSGIYTRNFVTTMGCDSVVTLNLTINHSNTGDVNAQGTNSYTWTSGNGNTYTTSGNYTWTTTNVAGCDSVVTLHLTIITGKPLPTIVAYNGKVLMVNHYPDGKDAGDYVDYDAYQWYKDGVAIDGAELDYYNEGDYSTLSGCYYVMVPTDASRNEWVSSNTLCFDNNGIDDVEALEVSFTVAPNPVANGSMMRVSTNLDEAKLQGARLVMYDIRGRKVMEQAMETSTVMVAVNQASGAYMLRLITKEGETYVVKVVVK